MLWAFPWLISGLQLHLKVMLADSVGFCSMLYKPVSAAPATATNHPIAAALAHYLHSRPHDSWLLTFMPTLQAACRPEEAQSLADELHQAGPTAGRWDSGLPPRLQICERTCQR